MTITTSMTAQIPRTAGHEVVALLKPYAALVSLAGKALRFQAQIQRSGQAPAFAPLAAAGSSSEGVAHPSNARIAAHLTLSELEQFAATLHSEVLADVSRGAFYYEYQPIASCASGLVGGYEALVRWRRGGQTTLPADFLPVVEETGAIVQIQQRLLSDVAAAHHQLEASSFIAINWSPAQLSNSTAVSAFLGQIRELRIDPTRLVIEITEHTIAADPATARASIVRMKAAGLRIALDDFGKGYCGLGYLCNLPIDHIKIDGSLIAQLNRSPRSAAIIEGIIDLAHRLGSEVIAECVETEEQRTLLDKLDCDYMQGHLIGYPSRHLLPCRAAPRSERASVHEAFDAAGFPTKIPMNLLRGDWT